MVYGGGGCGDVGVLFVAVSDFMVIKIDLINFRRSISGFAIN